MITKGTTHTHTHVRTHSRFHVDYRSPVTLSGTRHTFVKENHRAPPKRARAYTLRVNTLRLHKSPVDRSRALSRLRSKHHQRRRCLGVADDVRAGLTLDTVKTIIGRHTEEMRVPFWMDRGREEESEREKERLQKIEASFPCRSHCNPTSSSSSSSRTMRTVCVSRMVNTFVQTRSRRRRKTRLPPAATGQMETDARTARARLSTHASRHVMHVLRSTCVSSRPTCSKQ